MEKESGMSRHIIFPFKLSLCFSYSGLLQILEQMDMFKLKPEPAKGLVKGVALIVSIMHTEQVGCHLSFRSSKICFTVNAGQNPDPSDIV